MVALGNQRVAQLKADGLRAGRPLRPDRASAAPASSRSSPTATTPSGTAASRRHPRVPMAVTLWKKCAPPDRLPRDRRGHRRRVRPPPLPRQQGARRIPGPVGPDEPKALTGGETTMSKVVRQIGFDEGAFVAREKEDVVVGDEIIRHRLSSRVIHWSVARHLLRLPRHRASRSGPPSSAGWRRSSAASASAASSTRGSASLFALASLAMAVHWWDEMKMTKEERGWVGPKLLEYLRDAANHDRIGKYNGGQKVYFYTSKLGALGLLVSGIVLWFPTSFPAWSCARSRHPSPRRHASSSSRSRSSFTSTSRAWPSPARSTR